MAEELGARIAFAADVCRRRGQYRKGPVRPLADFQRTIAIEPDPSFSEKLRRTRPSAEVLPQKILEAQVPSPDNLVLCSHALYYIESAEWMTNRDKLMLWLAPDGVSVVVVQNHHKDFAHMLEQFLGYRFNLPELASRFDARQGERYRATIATGPAPAVTRDLDSAFAMAAFMLNLISIPDPPTRRTLEEYVFEHFAFSVGNFASHAHRIS